MRTMPTTTRYTPVSKASAELILTGADDRQLERRETGVEHGPAGEQRCGRGPSGEEQSGAEDRPWPEPRAAPDLVDAARDVAERDRRAGEETAHEAAAGLVVAGEQQPERHHHHGVEHDSHRHVDEREPSQFGRLLTDFAPVLGRSPPHTGERHGADRGDGEHGDLADGVEASEVDEDHVHHVAAVAVGDRPSHHLVRDRWAQADAGGDSANTNTVAATVPAITSRTARRRGVDWRSNRSGSRRSTSTNTTVESVSTATCVRARSGAPDRTNSPAIA